MKQKGKAALPVLLGVIPAREGSTGIKNKNLQIVLGKPLICYTIEASLNYTNLSRVIVTTDSKEIAEISKKCGAEVPFLRPKSLATDSTGMLDVLRHAMLECDGTYGKDIDGIVLLDPTSPVRKKKDIKAMIRTFYKQEVDLVVGVCKSRRNPYFNMLKKNQGGFGELVLRGNYVRRQDAPSIYDISNTCWIFSRKAVLNGWRIPSRTALYEVDGDYIDIDEEQDLERFAWYLKQEKAC